MLWNWFKLHEILTLNISSPHYTKVNCAALYCSLCCGAVQGWQQTICSGYVPHALHVQGALCDDDTLRPVRAAHPQVCQQRPLPPSGRLQHKARYDTTPPFCLSYLLFYFFLSPFLVPSLPFSSPTLPCFLLFCLTLPCLSILCNAMPFTHPNWFHLFMHSLILS